jgi:hypothetical protein
MSPEQREFMNLAVPPARLNLEQTAWSLGFQPHDIPILVRAGLLHPLGRPAANAPKHFAAVELARLRADAKWLSRATDAIQRRWRQRAGRDGAAAVRNLHERIS